MSDYQFPQLISPLKDFREYFNENYSDCRKHKSHRQQLQSSKPWRNSEKGRKGKDKGRGRARHGKMGQEESHVVDDDTPTRTLEARTIEALAKYIKDGKARNIVVMTGAGISTSAGIPDFRSPDTGLYANLARLDLPYAEAVFDIGYFRKNPLPFYTLAQELYPGKYRPTITHSFINLLNKKGLLMQLFTQNIDCLEREAGVPDELIIEAHGSFARQSCIECKTPYPEDLMHKAINEKSVPHCLQKDCNGLVKPEIVFFGEQLPAAFFDNRHKPQEADLCIVMGTSLSVQPFASLPSFCDDATPRVLLNSERVGDLGARPDDVLILGDCDTGVRKLAEACGWLEELESLWAETARPGQFQPETATKGPMTDDTTRSPDERLEDEIDKITKGVEDTLKLNNTWVEKHTDENKPTAEADESNMSDRNPRSSLQSGSEGSLSHVFPWLNKKSSL
ncbi:NAD-dependent deacetylase sirtuin-2 [Corynespora cassiicola Philippines]|uniref:NAD-dependent deacetylase sirtuin-2 n=1 Tax=Corynespora cassiicola Philippines TaxID=1448308 RepID=A0A2T2N7L1_CORCC|nr:NAD-dependent deacetylase sirtuin-2 [Corynespora cassiicola Philippines]